MQAVWEIPTETPRESPSLLPQSLCAPPASRAETAYFSVYQLFRAWQSPPSSGSTCCCGPCSSWDLSLFSTHTQPDLRLSPSPWETSPPALFRCPQHPSLANVQLPTVPQVIWWREITWHWTWRGGEQCLDHHDSRILHVPSAILLKSPVFKRTFFYFKSLCFNKCCQGPNPVLHAENTAVTNSGLNYLLQRGNNY